MHTKLPSATAFVGQHGSWNRSTLSGYEVAFVPFKNGKPSGTRKPFLTGFIADSAAKKVYGRLVGVAFSKKGYPAGCRRCRQHHLVRKSRMKHAFRMNSFDYA